MPVHSTFVEQICQEPLNLPRAALEFARTVAYPNLDVGHYLGRLDALAERAGNYLPAGYPGTRRAILLSDFLFRQEGLRGNSLFYTDPRNSFLNEVLDRKLGLPILLSAIFIDVARRLGFDAHGVGMPGHFIVRVDVEEETLFLDPFHSGVRLSREDCFNLVKQVTGYRGDFRPHWLNPVRERDMLARMLNNLRMVYVQNKEWKPALCVLGLLQMTEPDQHTHVRDLGLLHQESGDAQAAIYFLEAYLMRHWNAPDADAVRGQLNSLSKNLAMRN
jgi:regulator of sirC expression with transglutaminase-like and TPR domain